jgi:hypothetical protein
MCAGEDIFIVVCNRLHPSNNERKEKMSNQTVIQDLCGPCKIIFEEAPTRETQPAPLPATKQRNLTDLLIIARDDIAGRIDKKERNKNRTPFLEILFTRHWEEPYRRIAGAEMPPFVVYTPSGSYTVADGHSLGASRDASTGLNQAEIWDQTGR